MAHLTLSLLGPMQVMLDGQPITGFAYDKVRALLAFLAIEADRPHRREALLGLFWPELPAAAARNNLRQALGMLRHALQDELAAPPFLLVSREAIEVNPAGDSWLDVTAFTALLDACVRHPHRHADRCASCAQRLTQAVTLYRGDLLHGFSLPDSVTFDEWALVQRERLHRQVLEALARLARYHERRAANEEGLAFARRLVELEPWHEAGHRQVMRLLWRSGQRTAALAHYERCCQVLADELGVEPEEATTALYHRMRADRRRGVIGEEPPVHRHNLPPPTAFIDREAELAQLTELLENPAHRLITVMGTGGIGKTRLAVEAARTQIATFTDGVTLVPLASVTDAQFVVPALLTALDVRLEGPRDPHAQLLAYLRDKELLLLLDNFEHLLDAAGLVTEVLQHTPRVSLLITSRECLQLQSEWLVDLEGLPVPSAVETPSAADNSAVALFVQSARRAQRDFALSPANWSYVVRICRLVAGLPLGLELAAAWVRVLPCQEIAQEIERSLDFLAGAARDVPARHQSLQAVFDHSWHRLSAEEQRVLSRLAVFRGGFGRAAAVDVAEASLPLLRALVDKSLVHSRRADRYELHEVVRQYASARLAAVPAAYAQTRDRHCAYYARLLECSKQPLQSVRQQEVGAELLAEIDNIRLAWQWAVAHRQFAALRQGVKALAYLCEVQGWFDEGIRLFRSAVEALQPLQSSGEPLRPEQTTALGLVLVYQGALTWRAGRNGEARAILEHSVALLRPPGDPEALSDSLAFLGATLTMMGDYAAARRLLHEALVLKEALPDEWDRALCLFLLGHLAYSVGAYPEAYERLHASLGIVRRLGHTRTIVANLNFLAMVACAQGKYAEAQTLLHECLADASHDRWNRAIALNQLGLVAHALGNEHEAEHLFQESIRLFREFGDQWGMAQALSHLGVTTIALGDYTQAQRIFHEAYQAAAAGQLLPIALDALMGLATVLVHDGQQAKAVELLVHILNHPACSQEVHHRALALHGELEKQLAPEQVAAIEKQARSRTFDSTVAILLA